MDLLTDKNRNKSDDRILHLERIEGVSVKTDSGAPSSTLFKVPGSKVHAIMDPQTLMWTFKYENGGLPEGLKGQWTTFNQLYKYANAYFNKRGLNIVRVED